MMQFAVTSVCVCMWRDQRDRREEASEETCYDFGKEGWRGSAWGEEEEEEVGGAERCHDQEERMSIIAATAPQ